LTVTMIAADAAAAAYDVRPYKCTVHLALPSNHYARYMKEVISVDQEISHKVIKNFTLVKEPPAEDCNVIEDGSSVGVETEDGGELRVLRM